MSRYLHARQLGDTYEVTGIDDAGIGLAQLQFAENAPNILFFRHDVGLETGTKIGAQTFVLRGIGQKLPRVLPNGHRLCANDDFMAGLGQFQQRFDLRRVGGCTGSAPAEADHQLIAGECLHAPLPDSSGVDSRLHLHLVGRGENVGSRPLAQLAGQLLGTGKVENNVSCMAPAAERLGSFMEDIGK